MSANSPNPNHGFSQRWFDEVWNKQREAAIDELRHTGARAYGFPSPSSSLSHEEFKEAYRQFNRAFSNIHVTIDEEVVEGDHVACRWTATVTHTGDALGFPATQQRVSFSGSAFMHMRDGKLHDAWNFFDFTAVIKQLQGN
jgi:steroid delta-isomerase-like uncharacterized protein